MVGDHDGDRSGDDQIKYTLFFLTHSVSLIHTLTDTHTHGSNVGVNTPHD